MTTKTERETLTNASHLNLKSTLAIVERELILEAMDYTKDNQSLAARLLGISRGKLRYKLREYKIIK
jgi:DNA-binding protein Fis